MTLLSRYVKLSVLRAFALVMLALTGLFSLLDFVEQLASVGQGRYHVADALVYVLLNVPSRLLQMAPVSMLMATLLALGSFARNSEYAVMSSLGISERRIIGYVLEITPPIVIVLFLLAEFLIPPAQQLAQAQRSAALSSSVSFHPENSLWAENNLEYLNVQQFQRGDVPVGIDIYDFAADGSLDTLTHADRAQIARDGTWLLAGVTRKRVHLALVTTDHLATLPWHSFLAPPQVRFLFLPVDSMPPVGLYRYIHGVGQQYRNVPQYERALWAKAAIPLSMLAMILIGAPCAFGPPRSQNTGRNIAIGVAVGIAFSLGQQILGHLGLLLDLGPAATALAPPLMVAIVAVSVFPDAYGRG